MWLGSAQIWFAKEVPCAGLLCNWERGLVVDRIFNSWLRFVKTNACGTSRLRQGHVWLFGVRIHWALFFVSDYWQWTDNCSVDERISKFKEWLKTRNEERILVVGHSDFFHQLSGKLLKNAEFHWFELEHWFALCSFVTHYKCQDRLKLPIHSVSAHHFHSFRFWCTTAPKCFYSSWLPPLVASGLPGHCSCPPQNASSVNGTVTVEQLPGASTVSISFIFQTLTLSRSVSPSNWVALALEHPLASMCMTCDLTSVLGELMVRKKKFQTILTLSGTSVGPH